MYKTLYYRILKIKLGKLFLLDKKKKDQDGTGLIL